MPTRKRSVKGLLRRFLSKLTGLSRAQLTRLIGQFLREKCVRPTAYRRRRFPTKYSCADIVLLAHVDQVHQGSPGRRRVAFSSASSKSTTARSSNALPNCLWDTSTTCANAPSIGDTVCISTRLDRHPCDRRTPPTRAARASRIPAYRHRALARTGRGKGSLHHQRGRRSDAMAGESVVSNTSMKTT